MDLTSVYSLLADVPAPAVEEPEAFGIGFMIAILLIGIGAFIFWLVMLIDCIRNPKLSSDMRIVWVLVVVLAGVIGAIVYAIAGRQGDPKGRHAYENDFE